MNKYVKLFKENCKRIEKHIIKEDNTLNNIKKSVNDLYKEINPNSDDKLPTTNDGKLDVYETTLAQIRNVPLYQIVCWGDDDHTYALDSNNVFHCVDDWNYYITFKEEVIFTTPLAAKRFAKHILEDGLDKYEDENMKNNVSSGTLQIAVMKLNEEYLDQNDLNGVMADKDSSVLECIDYLNIK